MMRQYTIAPLILLIKAYRLLLSPIMGQQCRFYPTCSHYSETALQRHGLLKGLWLTVIRLLKCHPWHEGGVDHVPGECCDDHHEQTTQTSFSVNSQPIKTAVSE